MHEVDEVELQLEPDPADGAVGQRRLGDVLPGGLQRVGGRQQRVLGQVTTRGRCGGQTLSGHPPPPGPDRLLGQPRVGAGATVRVPAVLVVLSDQPCKGH